MSCPIKMIGKCCSLPHCVYDAKISISRKNCFVLIFTGISFVKPQTVSLCKACKTRVTDDIETHCKEKAHYDNFVNIVNGKKTKAIEKEQEKAKKAGQDDAGTEGLGSNKRKLNPDEDSDSDDDDGNWKRKRRDYMETSDP